MFVKGMMMEEVLELVAAHDWEIVEDSTYEAYDGTMALQLVVWQGDHAVAVEVFHDKVDELEYIPAWAM